MPARIAALFDVHGNLPALEAVLAELERVAPDLIVIGGDVAAGPMPHGTLDRLLGLGERVTFIRGNSDREMIEARAGGGDPNAPWYAWMRWAGEQLTERQCALLSAQPLTRTFEVDELGPVLFCHATPRNDLQIITRLTPEARIAAIFDGVPPALVACGHTHVQYDRRVAGRRIVNPGSVGMPYEGEPAARWALFGPGVELKRTSYDFAAAAAAVRTTGYPDADRFVQRILVETPTAETMSQTFEDWSKRPPYL